MVDTLPRPKVTPDRYRELEMGSWQIMMLANTICNGDMGEMLVLRDLCTRHMERWTEDERLAHHELAARQGVTLLAEPGGKISHLKLVEPE